MRIGTARARPARWLAAGLALIALGGCTSAAQEAAWRRDAARPIVCSDAQDCALKWNRALTWIEMNSLRSLAIANDRVIQTKDPHEDSGNSAFRATMLRNSDGSGSIDFESWCDNILVCYPSRLQAAAEFGRYVMGR